MVLLYFGGTLFYLKELHTGCHGGWLNLYSHQQDARVLVSLPASWALVLVFLMTSTLTTVRWNLNVLLNCISLMADDVEFLDFIYWASLCQDILFFFLILQAFLIRKHLTQILNEFISFIHKSICIFFEVIDYLFNSTFITISFMSLHPVIERESPDVARALEVIRTEGAGQDVGTLWSLSTGPP